MRRGRKWSATKAVDEAESRLRHSDIVGTVCHGRQGLGQQRSTRWRGASTSDRRDLVQQEIRRKEEESRYVRSVEMGSQGLRTRWETEGRKLTWDNIWRYTPWQLQFILRAVHDVLPTPANLRNWGLTEEAKCLLCQEVGTLEHILSSCKVALQQGRYCWRHDQVLRTITHTVHWRLSGRRTAVFRQIHQLCEKRRAVEDNIRQEIDSWNLQRSKRLDPNGKLREKARLP